MSTYKLVYFNARGGGEPARFVFAQAGVTYEDKRVEYGKEEWTELKPSTPTGMLPILEVDGKQLNGAWVITRFLGERFGLAGSSDIENAEIAGISDVLQDFRVRMSQIMFPGEVGEERKVQMKKKFEEEDVPKYWGILESFCKKNNSADGWIYGTKATYVDFSIYCALDYLLKMVPNFFDQYPLIAKLKASVEALPNIAKWIKERPQTQY